jgi:hypothetical protein
MAHISSFLSLYKVSDLLFDREKTQMPELLNWIGPRTNGTIADFFMIVMIGYDVVCVNLEIGTNKWQIKIA